MTQRSLNGRSVYSLQGLVPGPIPDNTGRIRFNGVRFRSNEILIDGVSQAAPETSGDPVSAPPIDSIEKVHIATSSPTAEFGSAASGLVNITTKADGKAPYGTV